MNIKDVYLGKLYDYEQVYEEYQRNILKGTRLFMWINL